MQTLLAYIEAHNALPLAHIVHLGAGTCGELEHYRAMQAQHITLVEANKRIAQELSERAANMQEVTVVNVAIAESDGDSRLNIFNVGHENSLLPPTALRTLYPGLRQLEQQPVNTLSLTSLIAPLGLNQNGNNLLVVEIPGMETRALRSLSPAWLQHFQYLAVRGGREALFDGAEPLDSLNGWLERQGYDSVMDSPDADPDLPVRLYKLNVLAKDNQQLREALESLQSKFDAGLAQARIELDQQVAQRQKEINGLTQGKTALEQERAALKARQAELEKALETETRARTEHQRQAEERRSQVEALTKARDEQSQLVAQRQNEINGLTQGKTALEQERAALKARQAELEKALETETHARTEHQRQAEELRSQVEALTKARDEQSQLVAQRQKEINGLTQGKTALEQERAALKARQAELEKALETETRARTEHQRQAEERRSQVEALTKARDEQSQLVAQRQNEINGLTQGKTALEQERAALKARQAELEKALETETRARTEHQRQAEERRSQVEALTKARDEQSQLVAQRQNEINCLTQVKTSLELEKEALAGQQEDAGKLIAQLQSELHEARQAVSLSLKLQTLREADLKDLQARYQASREREAHQHQVLTKLGERLSMASSYFHQISQTDPQFPPAVSIRGDNQTNE